MTTLAAVMLALPETMEGASGTVAVFGSAALLSGIAVTAEHLVNGRRRPSRLETERSAQQRHS